MPGPINEAKFFGELDAATRKMKVAAEAVSRVFGLEVRKGIATAGFKKTGRSAASWNLSVSTILRFVQPKEFNNVQGAVEAGKRNLAGFTLGKTLHVSNVIDYIQEVEKNHPGRVELGFRTGVAQARARMRTVIAGALRTG